MLRTTAVEAKSIVQVFSGTEVLRALSRLFMLYVVVFMYEVNLSSAAWEVIILTVALGAHGCSHTRRHDCWSVYNRVPAGAAVDCMCSEAVFLWMPCMYSCSGTRIPSQRHHVRTTRGSGAACRGPSSAVHSPSRDEAALGTSAAALVEFEFEFEFEVQPQLARRVPSASEGPWTV
eukprot:COSAG02_NODE_2542_length_8571_cov_7.094429_4_plen_176_part_00